MVPPHTMNAPFSFFPSVPPWGLPSGSEAVPAGFGGLPAGSEALPAGFEALLAGSEALPNGYEALPAAS